MRRMYFNLLLHCRHPYQVITTIAIILTIHVSVKATKIYECGNAVDVPSLITIASSTN